MKWTRYAQELETGQEERLAESQVLRERDEARAEVERLRGDLERCNAAGTDALGKLLMKEEQRQREVERLQRELVRLRVVPVDVSKLADDELHRLEEEVIAEIGRRS